MATAAAIDIAHTPAGGRIALYGALGVSAGLPFAMVSSVLSLRLAAHGVGLVPIGFFTWVTLLPTFKFLWAPLLERIDVPGFGRCWGRARGWIMLAQLGVVASLVAMAISAADRSLAVTALCAVLLAFWSTTLEIAADGWRIELAPGQRQQAPIVAAYVWGYRGAMVLAGSGALIAADAAGWRIAYLATAAAALVPFAVLVATPPEPGDRGGRGGALAIGLVAGAAILLATALATMLIGTALMRFAAGAGIDATGNVAPVLFGLCLLPFVALALALPRIRRARADDRLRRSAAIGPYVDVFWRFGYATLPILAFVSCYRMGDVLALALSHPLMNAAGYSLTQIGIADGAVSLGASMAGVALGGWMAMRWPLGWTLACGAILSGAGNAIFAWLWHQPPGALALNLAVGLDQFAHGFEGAVFVIYLSLLVNPRYPVAQYALLSGFAFFVPRLLAGASGSIQARIGYDGFFALSGALSVAAILFLPMVMRIKPRSDL